MLINVYLEDAFLYNETLTYATDAVVEVGMRVKVPLRNRSVIAFVADVDVAADGDFQVQAVQEVLDTRPILNRELWDLAFWMAHQTVSPIIRCFQTILPNTLKPSSTAQKARQVRFLQRTEKPFIRLSAKQQEFADAFAHLETIPYQEARRMYSGIRKLIDEGYYEEIWQEKRYQEQAIELKDSDKALTPDQQDIYDRIAADEHQVYLLHGVTGSGKTEIYLQLARHVIAEGKQVLILVPEISLTPQMIERVTSRFGDTVALYHSGLGNQEKYEQYLRVKEGGAAIVVGTRSAVFMPFQKLGLIVCDEEHDPSYKQTTTPFYHGRDVAIHRGKVHGCPVILGSASPSLESYARALRGVYTLLELSARINRSFPAVHVVDTRQAMYQRESGYLTQELLDKIQYRLNIREQIILLLNRRGYMPLLKDSKTQEVMMCPHCDVALAYHRSENRVVCHQCGYMSQQLIDLQGNRVKLVGSGVGTERLVEMVQKHFPEARISRMDADTTRNKDSHQNILQGFIDHEADILIGTQMIAKGLDIENVTLVGIINADASLAYTDYRSVEQTFAMLLQASGRSGRGGRQGDVLIQTFNPEHYAVQFAIKQQYKHFFQEEMKYRKMAQYPPYQYLLAIIVSDEQEEKALEKALYFLQLYEQSGIEVIGPSKLRKLSKRYRVRMIFKSKDLDLMLERAHAAVSMYYRTQKGGIVVDVNPLTLE